MATLVCTRQVKIWANSIQSYSRIAISSPQREHMLHVKNTLSSQREMNTYCIWNSGGDWWSLCDDRRTGWLLQRAGGSFWGAASVLCFDFEGGYLVYIIGQNPLKPGMVHTPVSPALGRWSGRIRSSRSFLASTKFKASFQYMKPSLTLCTRTYTHTHSRESTEVC